MLEEGAPLLAAVRALGSLAKEDFFCNCFVWCSCFFINEIVKLCGELVPSLLSGCSVKKWCNSS